MAHWHVTCGSCASICMCCRSSSTHAIRVCPRPAHVSSVPSPVQLTARISQRSPQCVRSRVCRSRSSSWSACWFCSRSAASWATWWSQCSCRASELRAPLLSALKFWCSGGLGVLEFWCPGPGLLHSPSATLRLPLSTILLSSSSCAVPTTQSPQPKAHIQKLKRSPTREAPTLYLPYATWLISAAPPPRARGCAGVIVTGTQATASEPVELPQDHFLWFLSPHTQHTLRPPASRNLSISAFELTRPQARDPTPTSRQRWPTNRATGHRTRPTLAHSCTRRHRQYVYKVQYNTGNISLYRTWVCSGMLSL